jgi:hypothetical protein
MQKFKFLGQPLLGELAMSPERERERKKERKKERKREKNAICSGHLRMPAAKGSALTPLGPKMPFVVATYVYASS